MGIELCKYLNRFSMMPYFHSGINFFKWLLLSSGFNFCSENDSVKIEGGEQKCSFCFFWVCVCVSHKKRPVKGDTKAAQFNSICPRLLLGSCISSASQWGAAASKQPWQKAVPLSDYNLWSISIKGGVRRESYSNNYLEWAVSKPPPNSDFVSYVL